MNTENENAVFPPFSSLLCSSDLFNAAATTSSMEENKRLFSTVSVPEVATTEQNTRKRELMISDAFHNNTTKRKKIMYSEEQCHDQPQPEKILMTHDKRMVRKLQEAELVPVRRNQKLGDRITALQKLVSPYGKTDTASVLHETYVQIKLLQEQVKGLGGEEEGLRSKGLCLVPISFTQNLKTEDKTESSISKRTSFTPRIHY
ncbi:hypothetical protein NE237_002800 [Protea cynaroides]|uniref:BHLH domain-containing protein n=1 Tax=Protea cynaroides TaxID=273540 RepID=A0A9Q0KFV5_9MAGN|nr:hypothetical protein NE237_002800 [Protea cynaroides]